MASSSFMTPLLVEHAQQTGKYNCTETCINMVYKAKKISGAVNPVSQKGLKAEDVPTYYAEHGFKLYQGTDLVPLVTKYGPVIASLNFPRGGLGSEYRDYNHEVVVVGGHFTGNKLTTIIVLDPASTKQSTAMDYLEFWERCEEIWVHVMPITK